MHSYCSSDRKVEAMAEKGLKWRDIFLALLGTILSFADPITDILTLVEFDRADHKKWFTVGLVFIDFPCSLYFLVHCTLNLFKVQYQTDSHASVPVWFSSILPSFSETKNAYFRPQETLEEQ